MSCFKYICNTCNLTFENSDSAAAHILKIKHKNIIYVIAVLLVQNIKKLIIC